MLSAASLLRRLRLPVAFVLFALLGSPLVAQTTQADQPPPPSPLPTSGMEEGDEASAVHVDAGDHPSLQAAIDALPAAGGVVKIPPGVFEISEPLTVRTGDTRIEGSGTATQIRNVNAEGGAAMVIRPADFENQPRARLWRVEVCNLRITGNQFTNSYIGEGKLRRADGIDAEQPWRKDICAGIVLEETEDVLISSNQFSGLTTRAVEARGACARLMVTHNLITDHGRGLPEGTEPIETGDATESVFEPNMIQGR